MFSIWLVETFGNVPYLYVTKLKISCWTSITFAFNFILLNDSKKVVFMQ